MISLERTFPSHRKFPLTASSRMQYSWHTIGIEYTGSCLPRLLCSDILVYSIPATQRLSHFSSIIWYTGTVNVTGEKLWLDRGSSPGPFADCANTLPLSYRVTRSSHQQLFTLTLPGNINNLISHEIKVILL